jgi:riboflavin biosynthesis pyrimidine reductase
VRLLLNDIDPSVPPGSELDTEALARLYAYPSGGGWLRANMVSTLDGAATGPDGKTGSINNEADHKVFMLLRTLADVVIAGAGTARAEGYGRTRPPAGELAALRTGRPAAPTLLLVSRSAALPPKLATPPDEAEGEQGDVLLATCEAAGEQALDAAREALGEDTVLVLGTAEVDLPDLVDHLLERGLSRMLTEGGPHLLRDMAAAGVVDEICLTVVPQVLGGAHPRILAGGDVDLALSPRLLLEAEGTLLGRWSRP